MEHRCGIRKSMALDVVLSYRALGLVKGRTHNISMGGMFVETGCIQLPVNALVEASISLSNESGPNEVRSTQAMVVHTGAGGAGLMFSDLDLGFAEMFRKLIFGIGVDDPRSVVDF